MMEREATYHSRSRFRGRCCWRLLQSRLWLLLDKNSWLLRRFCDHDGGLLFLSYRFGISVCFESSVRFLVAGMLLSSNEKQCMNNSADAQSAQAKNKVEDDIFDGASCQQDGQPGNEKGEDEEDQGLMTTGTCDSGAISRGWRALRRRYLGRGVLGAGLRWSVLRSRLACRRVLGSGVLRGRHAGR